MGYIAYIIRSEQTGTYYKGSCADFDKRLEAHNAGSVRSTKGKRPWKKHYIEELPSKTEGLRREKFLKSRTGYRWLKKNEII
jgi:putative endonuclease